MKQTLLIILFLNLYQLNAQENIVNPPGTIHLKDNLYIDKTPVTNIMFLEYLSANNFLKKKGYKSVKHYFKSTDGNSYPSEMFAFIYPSPLLYDLNTINYLKRRLYYKDYKYRYHPILNILKKQAMDFCRWRTPMVEHLWLIDEKYLTNREIAQKISYRLASEDEILLAKKVFSERKKITDFKDKNLLPINLKLEVENFIILPISELTESEVIIKHNTTRKSRHNFIGFRCVCEIKK